MPDEIQDLNDALSQYTEEELVRLYNDAKATRFTRLRPRLPAARDFHGHLFHICEWPCSYLVSRLTPDFPIEVQRVGGGAAAEGFAAYVWPDELHTVALLDHDDIPVEDWTAEDCFTRAIRALYLRPDTHPGSPSTLNFPGRESILYPSDILSAFGVPWQHAALLHDIADVCLAIDSGGLQS